MSNSDRGLGASSPDTSSAKSPATPAIPETKVLKYSNGKVKDPNKPSCIRPRDKHGNVIKSGTCKKGTGGSGFGGVGEKAAAPKKTKKNVCDNIPVKPAPEGPKSSTRVERNLSHEFKFHVIGPAHNLGDETKEKVFSNIDTICLYMQKVQNLNSIRSMGVHHLQHFAEWLKHDSVSQKTGGTYAVSQIYDMFGRALWMHKVMNPAAEYPIKRGDFGIYKNRTDVHNPVDFSLPQYREYEANRDAIHNIIAEFKQWLDAPDRLGREFGLREAEVLGTKGDMIRMKDGKLELSHRGGPFKPTSVKQLSNIYGHASYGEYSKHVKEGVTSLVVEWSKDKLGRFVPIETQAQWDAIKAIREHCKAMNTKSGRCFPDVDENGNPYKKAQAIKALDNAWQKAKNELGLTGKENYGYTQNGGRHHYVQYLVAVGLSDREIIIRVGHFSTEKLDYYRKKLR